MARTHRSFLFWILMILQIISFGILIMFASSTHMLPSKYLILAGVALLMVCGIEIVLNALGSWTRVIAIIIVICMLTVSIFGSVVISKAENTIDEIASDKEYYDEIVVLVKKDSDIHTLQQIDSKVIGVQSTFQPELIHAAQCVLNDKHHIDFIAKNYNTVIEQILALLNEEVDVVLYNKSHEELLIEQMPNFTEQTRVVSVLNITESMVARYENMTLDNGTNITQPESTTQPITPEVTEPPQSINSNTFAVYLSGVDREGRINVNGRSDVNMLAIVNPDTKKILLINTPRDYFVQIPGISGDKKDKLTHAGIYGVNASMNTLSALYDVPIQYYIKVNFTSFEDVIDALGGIEVYSAYSFESRGATFKKGMNKLNGEEALKFCRERYAFKDGDNQRGRNQQEVIKAMIKKACSTKILTSAMSILDSVRKNIDMNIPDDMIRSMVKEQLDTGAEWEIITMAAVGTDGSEEPFSMPGYKAYVMLPVQESVDAIKVAIKEMY